MSGRRPGEGQLPLALPPLAALGRDDFVVGLTNRIAAEAIDRWPDWPAPLVLLVGPPGSGKSHLAGAWADRAGARTIAAAALAGHDPLELAGAGPLVVEDVDRAGDVGVPLFHLLNAVQAAGATALMTARRGPETALPGPPDLVSRLRAATRLSIDEPDDALLRQVLVKLFADRQLAVEPAVIDYLAVRMERSLAVAGAVVAAVDGEALAGRRPVTRPLVAAVLDRWMAADPD